jgi:cytidylate kinase
MDCLPTLCAGALAAVLVSRAKARAAPGRVTVTTLARQDAATSAAIIGMLGGGGGSVKCSFSSSESSSSSRFATLAQLEGISIVQRDAEDARKLQAGVELSIASGQLARQDAPPAYMSIDVMGKTPDEVCDIILRDMGAAVRDSGGIVVLCGLSGTGKGTTVRRLGARLAAGKSTAWSNGNVFRSLTLLAATWCEQQQPGGAFDAAAALTPRNLDMFMGMLEFAKFDGKWDIKIEGLGIRAMVSDVQNTLLKSAKVKSTIPTVARQTQGTVVKFAAAAAQKMAADGLIVLLEGREATVNYIPSRCRYTLTMSDNVALGQRRAAQRIGAAAQAKVAERGNGGDVPAVSEAELAEIIRVELARLAGEEEKAHMAQSGPVIYEVNLLIDEDIYVPYMAWLKPHMQEMLTIDGFCSARLCDAVHLPSDEAATSGQRRAVASYVLTSRAHLQEYFDVHAARLRGDGVNRFKGKFSARRRIFSNMDEI